MQTAMTYAEAMQRPMIQRFGTWREIMEWVWRMAGGCVRAADGVNPYHRYGFGDETCPFG